MLRWQLLLLAACAFVGHALRRAQAPVIAVLAMPEFKPPPWQAKRSYIAASYVKWLEAHGARVVPLLYDAPRSETTQLLSQVNGVLFPGGAFPMEPEYEAFSRFVFNQSLSHKIPAWGECLGLLQFLLYTSGQDSPGPVTDGWDARGPLISPVHLTTAGMKQGPMAKFPAELLEGIQNQPWAWHSHAYSTSVEAFEASPSMVAFWDVLAIDEDRRGHPFISIIAAKDFPVTATMFHPEKNSFEFMPARVTGTDIPEAARSSAAMDAMSHLGFYFLDQCRSFREHSFSQQELMTWNIHNWAPEHTAPKDSVFEEIYFFPARNTAPRPAMTGNQQPLSHWGSF